MRRLQGRSALIIGGGQLAGEDTGNGRAVAQLFGANGARVCVVDRNLEAAEETAGLIVGSGGEAFAVRADVQSESEVIGAIRQCRSHFGSIDILHNNVGVSAAAGDAPLSEIDTEAFDRVMSINLRGMFLACRHAIPVMREQRRGVILTVSSIAAIMNYPNVGYRTSKAAVVSMTKHIAIANAGYGIRANSILPGLINTPMAVEPRIARNGMTREQVIASRAEQVPLAGVVPTAWDVANAALFLASDDARFITGIGLVVDGGQTLMVG